MDLSLFSLPEKNVFTGMNLTKITRVYHTENAAALGKMAGEAAALAIKKVIETKGRANIILATGTSQFETLNHLIAEPGIDWTKVTMFHLDEYIGLPITAKASFRKYLKERFIDKIPSLKAANLINAEEDPVAECKRLGNLIAKHSIDVALVGIGENGHLAFNDPPANFETADPYIIVDLDEACRRQQYNEGWFDTMEEVPKQAISMSIKQIMQSKKIICSVPDSRKAEAVRNTLEEPISNQVPASILREHADCTIYLDRDSAALLTKRGSVL
jgi:glucosamine-6-phosphate deaminase